MRSIMTTNAMVEYVRVLAMVHNACKMKCEKYYLNTHLLTHGYSLILSQHLFLTQFHYYLPICSSCIISAMPCVSAAVMPPIAAPNPCWIRFVGDAGDDAERMFASAGGASAPLTSASPSVSVAAPSPKDAVTVSGTRRIDAGYQSAYDSRMCETSFIYHRNQT